MRWGNVLGVHSRASAAFTQLGDPGQVTDGLARTGATVLSQVALRRTGAWA